MSDLDSLFAKASSLSVHSPGLSCPASPASSPARVGGLGAGTDVGGGGAGGRFGRGRGHLMSKSYSVVSVLGSDPTVCFGSVGAGGVSFCVRQNCTIKAHIESKVEPWDSPEESRIFIVTKEQNDLVNV